MMPTYGIPLHLKNKIKQIGYNEMDRQGELRFWKWLAVIGWLLFFLPLGLYFFENGKRCGRSFLQALDKYIYEKILRCLKEHNGGQKTLDESLVNLTK